MKTITQNIPVFFIRFMAVNLALLPLTARGDTVSLSSLDLKFMSSGWGKARANKAVTGKALRMGGREFADGVGTHAESELFVELGGRAERFQALVGVDAGAVETWRKPPACESMTNASRRLAPLTAKGSVEFIVSGDDRELWKSGVCRHGDAPRVCDVPLRGVKFLLLTVTDAGDGKDFDHADWAEARITFTGAPPRAIAAPPAPPEEAVLLTPPAPALPRINGPKVYGVRPGHPFLYRIPATGERPMTFAAEGLPAGLSLDAQSGIITGTVAARIPNMGGASAPRPAQPETQQGRGAEAPPTFRVTLVAKNGRGEARREFRIVVGNTLALTPPMGWNSWYIHYNRVTDADLRAAADVMIASGMADYGYQYVNIDDCWMVKPGSDDPTLGGPAREPDGRLRPNKRFPDMRALSDYIHRKGLKAGLYTSPGPLTCAKFEGAWQHEAQDARTFAEWGFDFLKYDWCSYGKIAPDKELASLKKPYQVMWAELQKLDRDIVHNLCQYGMGEVWRWGGEVGHCWRTTGDLGLERGARLPGFYRIGLSNAQHWEYARPGAWNDPDYILIGWVGDAHVQGEGRPTTLTPSEQYAYMSLWCLMAAPLVYSGDMTKLDPFTLNILCNHELIEVNQDPLGKQARIAKQTRDALILVKDLEDDSKAVGLFNLAHTPAKLTADWPLLGLTGPQRARDLWRQRDLGTVNGAFEADVPRHGAVVVRLWADK